MPLAGRARNAPARGPDTTLSSDSLFLHDDSGVSLDDHNPRGHVRSAEAATIARADSSVRRGTSVMSKESAAAPPGFRFGLDGCGADGCFTAVADDGANRSDAWLR